jgi:hypothetical protein
MRAGNLKRIAHIRRYGEPVIDEAGREVPSGVTVTLRRAELVSREITEAQTEPGARATEKLVLRIRNDRDEAVLTSDVIALDDDSREFNITSLATLENGRVLEIHCEGAAS